MAQPARKLRVRSPERDAARERYAKWVKRNKKHIQEMWAVATELLIEASNQGYTIATLAKKAKVSKTTIYNLYFRRTRFPQFMTLQKIAKALGYTYVPIQDIGVEQ